MIFIFDFELSNSGDFILQEAQKFPTLSIQWRQTTYPTLEIKFVYEKTEVNDFVPKNTLSIIFTTDSYQQKTFTKTNTLTTDLENLKQKIIILLRTELGETSLDKSLGTRLVLHKHRNMNLTEVLQDIHDLIKENLTDILDDPIVMVQPELRDGAFYCQNINVYINDGNKEIFNFSI